MIDNDAQYYNTRAPKIAAAEATSKVAQVPAGALALRAPLTVVSWENAILGVIAEELVP